MTATATAVSAPAARPAAAPARPGLLDALRRAALREWEALCRQAERPTRKVPYC